MKKKLIVAAVAILILAGGFGLMRYFASLKEAPPERTPPVSANFVKVEPVKYNKIETEIVAYGRVGSSQPIDLIAEVGGRLLPGAVPVKEGQNFRRGQLLFRVFDDEVKLNLQSRKSEFLNILATILPDIKIDFPDSFQNWDQYFQQIDIEKELPQLPKPASSKEKTFLAVRNILRDYYSIKSQEENLRKYFVYAPYNGSFSSVTLEAGTIVRPGSNIARIIRTDQLELEIPVEVKDIKWLEIGKQVNIYTQNEQSEWTGRIVRIGDIVNPNTQSINVYIDINSKSEDPIYDGLYLKAVIPGKSIEAGMEIPRRIIHNENEIFIVEQGELKSRQINIEKVDRDNVIFSGLEEGKVVVLEAPTNASEGMKVEVLKNS